MSRGDGPAGRQRGDRDQGLLMQGGCAHSKHHLHLQPGAHFCTWPDFPTSSGINLLGGECCEGDRTQLLLIIFLWYYGHDYHLIYSD